MKRQFLPGCLSQRWNIWGCNMSGCFTLSHDRPGIFLHIGEVWETESSCRGHMCLQEGSQDKREIGVPQANSSEGINEMEPGLLVSGL